MATSLRPAPRLRRAYYECSFGQLHLHNAIPAGGGFNELTTVVCLHGQNQTGRAFAPWLPLLGAERSVYALDMPGAGESDVAGVDATDAGLQVLGEFIDTMRIRSFDVIAWGSGCAIARRVAAERAAAVRKLVLMDDPAAAARLPTQPVLSLQTNSAGLSELGAKVVTFLAAGQA
jgi:pimeloyl-ACP methyl ester carboxylesterase